MQCSDCSCPSKSKTTVLNQTLSLSTNESTKVPANVKVVLVKAADVEVTLPFQPAAGTQVTVATRSTGTTVVPGTAASSGGCCDDDAEPVADTFCDDEESVALAECTQAIFTYFPPDPCDTAVKGTWVYLTVAPVVPETP